MSRYVGSRILQSIPALLGVTVIVFLLLQLSGDPASILLPLDASDADRAAFRRQYGLDQPIPVQYASYMSELLRGDFGESFAYQEPALRVVMRRLPATLELAVLATILANLIAVPAGIFAALGSEVTLLYRGEMILRGFDRDVRTFLADEQRKKKIDLRLKTDVTRVDKTMRGLAVALTDGKTIETDAVMMATGRAPNTKTLGLAELGVKMNEKGAILVDEWSRSSVPSIYAVGDVTDRINLTPVATAEGHAFADTLYGNRPRQMDRRDIPSAVFSQPSVAVVGLSEDAAREKGFAVDIYRTDFRPMKHTLSGRDERMMMKLVVDRASDRVLGAHMVGADAAEIIQGLAIAIKAGATKAQFDATIGIHPSAAEEFVTLRTKVPEPAAKAAE